MSYLAYNDIIVSDFDGFGIVSEEISSIPDREINSKSIQDRSGSIFLSTRDEDREITLTINVRTKNIDDYNQTVQDMKTCFDHREEAKLYLDSEDKYINAAVKSYNFSDVFVVENSCYGEGEIKFICSDPYFYKGDEKYYDNDSQEAVTNEGDIETYPKISVEFEEDSTFLQVDSERGSILIGEYPKVGQTNATEDELVLYEKCQSLSGWTAAGNVVDEGATNDTMVLGDDGDSFVPNISSSQDTGWHGCCYRRNLDSNIKNFILNGFFCFYSDYIDFGNGDTSQGGNTSNGSYKTTAALRIRNGRGTSYKILGTIPKGTLVSVTDISGGWGKVTYNGKTGYCYMLYLSKVSESSSSYNYKTTANLRLRSGRGTKYKIKKTIPKGTSLKITDISSGWGKTTYKGSSGYVSMSYVSKLASSSAISIIGKEEDDSGSETTTSDMLGLLELYGFDSNNNKLFKFQLLDNNYYYRDTKPSAYIGSNLVLTDTTQCPAPKTKKDKDGNRIKVKSGDSSSAWNRGYIRFHIERKEDIWSLKISRNNRNSETITPPTPLIYEGLYNEKYPTGDLSYVVLYMAAYGSYKIQNMSMTCMNIHNLTPQTPEPFNPIIFTAGDRLDIDCNEGTVLKNGESFMEKIDIGSTFFPLVPGTNSVSVYSSTTSLSAAISFIEKFN